MAVPKRKTTRSKRNSRKNSKRRNVIINISECSQCHQPKLPHRICPNCGFYNGKEVLSVEPK